MKKWWLVGLLVIIALSIANFMLNPASQNSVETVTHLPWQIEITEQGNTRVFDIDVGKTTLQQATQQINQESWTNPEVALFQAPDGSYRLESFLGKIKLGPFEARVIFRLDATDDQLAEFAANSLSRKATPSGNHQLRLSEPDFDKALQMPILELTYAPAVDTKTALLEQLFGAPEERIIINVDSSYWTYPQRGLVILMHEQDKEVFHYFAPRDFDRMSSEIKQLQQSGEIPSEEN